MDRYKMLPSYHYVENEDGVINNPATDKVRTCTIYGNHGKNLIPFPYVGKSGTYNGVTITVDSDGVITLNGTSTASVYFGLLSPVNSSEITKPGLEQSVEFLFSVMWTEVGGRSTLISATAQLSLLQAVLNMLPCK